MSAHRFLAGNSLLCRISATDLLFTSALLKGNCEAYESNPIAAAFLEQHGLRGLALYKIGGVIAFTGSVVLLARRRPKVAAGLVCVTVGCAVILSVVMYSHGLIRDARTAAHYDAEHGIVRSGKKSPHAHEDFELPAWCSVAIR